MAYIGNGPGVSSQRIVSEFELTTNTTSFTPSSGYTVGYVDVYLNGIKLQNGTDFTASNGTNVVLTDAAVSGDLVEIVAYIPRGLSDGYTKSEADARYEPIDTAYTKSESDARYVNLSGGIMSGNLTVSGASVISPLGDFLQIELGSNSASSTTDLRTLGQFVCGSQNNQWYTVQSATEGFYWKSGVNGYNTGYSGGTTLMQLLPNQLDVYTELYSVNSPYHTKNRVSSSTSLDTKTYIGTYTGYGWTAGTPSGTGWSYLDVYGNGSDQKQQKYRKAEYEGGQTYIRESTNPSTTAWGAWRETAEGQDYEEGTFTVTSTRAGVGEDSGGWIAKYVKIGRLVHVTISTNTWVRHYGSGYGVGQAFQINTNLPFVPSGHGGGRVAHTRTLANADLISLAWRNGSSAIYLNECGNNNGYDPTNNVTTANTQTNITLTFSGSYYTSQ